MDLRIRIKAALLELKKASLSVPENTEGKLHTLIEKYDMIFMGPKMNVINSIELLHTLKEKFSIDISLENLNGLLPNLCTELGMKTESLISLQDAGEPDVSGPRRPFCFHVSTKCLPGKLFRRDLRDFSLDLLLLQ